MPPRPSSSRISYREATTLPRCSDEGDGPSVAPHAKHVVACSSFSARQEGQFTVLKCPGALSSETKLEADSNHASRCEPLSVAPGCQDVRRTVRLDRIVKVVTEVDERRRRDGIYDELGLVEGVVESESQLRREPRR